MMQKTKGDSQVGGVCADSTFLFLLYQEVHAEYISFYRVPFSFSAILSTSYVTISSKGTPVKKFIYQKVKIMLDIHHNLW